MTRQDRPAPAKPKRLYSQKEVCAYCGGVSRQTIAMWARKSGFPLRKVPNTQTVWARPEEIDAWFENHPRR
jgi:hypothetical protein